MSSIDLGISTEDMNVVQQATPQLTVIEMLKKAVCDEFCAEYQYIIAEHSARGTGYCDATPEYKQHAQEEHDHALKLLKRLEQLKVIFNPDLTGIQSGGNPWVPIKTSNVKEQLDILIKAEADAQAFYKQIIKQARVEDDEITVRLIKELLTDECEHETDLTRIIEQF